MVFSAPDTPVGEVQVLFEHQKEMKPSPWIWSALST
jgi:hypothetical protein